MGIGAADTQGVLPRVIHQIYKQQNRLRHRVEVIIKVSFLEIYNEEIYDLMDNGCKSNNKAIGIREERDGSVAVYGA